VVIIFQLFEENLKYFLLGAFAIATYFSAQLGAQSFTYLSLKSRAAARIKEWEIVQSGGRFALRASYEFDAQGKRWSNSFILNPPYYLNEFSAFDSLKEKAKESFEAWYAPQNPEISALERCFPMNLLFRTLICCGVLVYFFRLYKRSIVV